MNKEAMETIALCIHQLHHMLSEKHWDARDRIIKMAHLRWEHTNAQLQEIQKETIEEIDSIQKLTNEWKERLLALKLPNGMGVSFQK